MAESRSSSLQEESFKSETLLQAEKEKEKCDIAIQTDKVSSYVAS